MERTRYVFGQWWEPGEWSAADVEMLCALAEERRRQIANYPLDKVLSVLEALGRLWSRPDYPHRQWLERELPAATGFSAPMIRLAMEELVNTLDPEVLFQKVQTEMRGLSSAGGSWFRESDRTEMKWSPLGTVLHVLSGNVFLVGLGSLVEGLLTGNVTILKMASGEKLFLPRLMDSLQSVDPEGIVSGSVALVDYPSSRRDIIEELQKRVDGILVWGGEEAVRAYRNGLGAGKKFIMFGPKLSFAVVTKAGLEAWGMERVAEKLAWEMSIWDQNACTAPQLCYVEGEGAAKALMPALGAALEKLQTTLTPGAADTHAAVEIQKWRTIADIAEARGEGAVLRSPRGVDWTVLVDRKKTIEPAPLHRTLRLVPFDRLSEVIEEAEGVRGYLQTVGLAASPEETGPWFDALARAGALKVGTLGTMSGGSIDDPHDGAYDLPQLGHFVVGRFEGQGPAPEETLTAESRKGLVDARLRRLVRRAMGSPFYRDRLTHVTIEGVGDLGKIPPLTREEMDANMPPKGTALATGHWFGGYVSRSGGSTGEPKFSVYDSHDWDKMIGGAVKVFRALGMRPGDRVANFMLAGDLYGSFVSFDHINYRAGATSFAFANHVDPELFVKAWRQFRMNVIQGIPARIVLLLRQAKALEPTLEIPTVIFAGTPMSQTDRDWLKAEVGARRVASVIGANDGGQVAFQCEHLSGGLHHLTDDFNWVEIVDDKYQPVPDGQGGRILITSLEKFAFPLIRYELGDAGRIVPDYRCGCGRTYRVMEFLGRADDQICVGLMNLAYHDIYNALSGISFSGLQIAAQEHDHGDEIVLRIEAEDTSEAHRTYIRAQVLERIEKIAAEVKTGTLADFRVELFPIASLPRNERSGKLKTIVDERK